MSADNYKNCIPRAVRTLLWAIAGSPLILGNNLTRVDRIADDETVGGGEIRQPAM
jgi:hypothetical protein